MRFSTVLALALVSCVLAVSGCSTKQTLTTTNTGVNSAQGVTLQGRVHGGQNPIKGSHVYLLLLSTTGYGGPGIPASSSNAATYMLTSGTAQDGNGHWYVVTDANGNFSVTGNYTCPTNQHAAAYYLAVGGDAGSGTSNSAIALIAPFDSCSSSAFTVVNEVTTVVTDFIAAGIITDLTHVGTSGSTLALSGLSSININNVVNVSTGQANTTTLGGNGTVPQAEINTLANIIAGCVNSTGPTSTQCTTLFSNAKNGSTTPTDTATAALNIAHNPGANIANLFALQTGSSPFQPSLSSAPNDFTIALTFTGSGLTGPGFLAIDASGNVWVANAGAKSITELGPDGSQTGFIGGGAGGLTAPFGVAIDASGNVWVANSGLTAGVACNCISEFASNGTPLSPSSGYTGGGLNTPEGMTVDTSGNAWAMGPNANSISEFNSSGTALSGSGGITSGGLSAPFGAAIDSSGNVWVSNTTGNTLSEFNSGGTANASSPFGGGGLNNPRGIAIDASNNIWVPSRGNNVLGKFNSSGAPVTTTGYTGGGLNQPNWAAVDSAGNVWVANIGGNTISEFDSNGNAISGSTGYQAGLNTPRALAIDGAGNVWVSNAGNNSVTEFLGVASPVVTPIVANLISPYSHAASRP